MILNPAQEGEARDPGGNALKAVQAGTHDGRLLLALVLSGFAALGYQFLWIRLLTAVVGSETLAVTGVVAGFFLGMGLGSLLLRDRVRASASPARLFAILEVAAAAYAIASPWLIPWAGGGMLRWAPAELPPVATLFSGMATSVALLLLPSLCMGATLPALVAAGERRTVPGLLSIGRLYAANTLGAMLGTLCGVYVIFALGGFGWGGVLLGTAGLASAALAISWQRCQTRHAETPKDQTLDSSTPAHVSPAFLLFLSGMAGIGMEIVAARVMTQVMRSTVYTYANLLAVYLVGTAIGAWLYARMADRLAVARNATVAVWLLAAGAVSTAAAAWALRATPAIVERIAPDGASFFQQCAAELLSAAAVFLLPTMVMGALFSHLMGAASVRGKGTGGAYAANTLGAALAPMVYALLVIPKAGYRGAMLAVGATYLLAVMVAGMRDRRNRQWLAAAAASVAALAFLPRLVLIEPERGWRVLAEWQGIMGLTRVTETMPRAIGGAGGIRMLQVDRHFFMGGGAGISESRMGQMPLMLAPQAEDVLYLGVGTGATAGAVTRFPNIRHADAVELVPEVLHALPSFDAVNAGVRHDPRVRFHASDAIRFAANPPRQYDLVVGDLFHPHRDGAAFLYTTDHFTNVRDRCLKPGAPFCQWIPLFQFDPESLRVLLASFLSVFPECHAFLGDAGADAPLLLVVGRLPRSDSDRLVIEVPDREALEPGDSLTSVTLTDLLGSHLLDRSGMAAFAGDSPANTNRRPRLLFTVPRAQRSDHGDSTFASLAALLESSDSRPPLPMHAASPDVREAADSVAAARASAMRKLFEADVLRTTANGDPDQLRRAMAGALSARDADPTYMPAHLLVKMLAAQIAGAGPSAEPQRDSAEQRGEVPP